jgi:hypothetical protein
MRTIAQVRKEKKMPTEEILFYEVEEIPTGWQEIIEKKTNSRLNIVD